MTRRVLRDGSTIHRSMHMPEDVEWVDGEEGRDRQVPPREDGVHSNVSHCTWRWNPVIGMDRGIMNIN